MDGKPGHQEALQKPKKSTRRSGQARRPENQVGSLVTRRPKQHKRIPEEAGSSPEASENEWEARSPGAPAKTKNAPGDRARPRGLKLRWEAW